MENKRYETLEDFYNDALNYCSIRDMAKGIGRSNKFVYNRLKKLKDNNLELSISLQIIWNKKQEENKILNECKRTTYDFNDYVFHTFTPDSVYWLGMLASDGCVYENRNKIYINAQAEDKEHIESFIKFIDYTGEVKERPAKCKGKEYPSVYLELNSKIMKERLIELGIVSDKSNKDIDYLNYIPEEYKMYFILGYLDGDGSIVNSISAKSITILGNFLFINSIIDYLSTHYIFSTITEVKRKDMKNKNKKYNLNMQQYYSMYLFCKEYLKYDSPYQLKRKKEKVEELLSFLEERIKNNGNLKYHNSYFIDLRKKEKCSYSEDKRKIKKCPYCEKGIRSTSSMCMSCYGVNLRKVERPSREVLKEEIRTIPFLKLSEKYGVTDNAIKKWCKSYGLPYKKSEIKLISDEEWLNI